MLLKPNSSNNYLGRQLNITIPKEIYQKDKEIKYSGDSRYVEIIRDRVISEAKSWLERKKVVEGRSSKFVNKGWLRTADPTRPSNLNPKMNLGSIDKQYAEIINNPFNDGIIELKLVINRQWYLLTFNFDKERFKGSKRLSLPVVRIDDSDHLVFDWSVVFEYNFSDFSSRYVVGVDVGVSNPATVSVVDVLSREIVEFSFLSRRVHSLKNSIDATSNQIIFLYQKLGKCFSYGVFDEIVRQREKNSRKKKELAVLIGQEVADFSVKYDNAVVVLEDLSWIRNTMVFGWWNRGTVCKWIEHYVNLNGGRVFKVNAAGTSQKCFKCGEQLDLSDYHVARCVCCGSSIDRDVNAAGNIAYRFRAALVKCVDTRRRSKRFVNGVVRRSPVKRNSLRFPKSGATARQRKKMKSFAFVGEGSSSLNDLNGSVIDNMVTVIADGEMNGFARTFEEQPRYDCFKRFNRLIQ